MSNKINFKCIVFLILVFFGIIISFNLCKANQAQGSLVINEIVARTTDGSNDWIELYVVGNDPVYLGNFALMDDAEGRTPAPLPGITLGPGEFIVIQATDQDPNDGSYYVPFRLGADDAVTLFWGINIVDVLDWEDGDAPAGYSYGRYPDGTGWLQTLAPTPNAMNEAPLTSFLVINEILAQDPNGGNDWIELYVIGNDPVFLEDYSLVDDKEGRELAPLPDITLGPGEFIVILATDEAPNDGSYYVPFKLGADDSVTLYLGPDIVDMLDWVDGEAPSGVSYGLLPDGTGEAQPMTPTPGASNQMFNLFATDKVVEVRLQLTVEDWQAILADPMAEEYQPANIIYNGIRLEDVAVRTKGQSSLMSVAMDPNSNRYSFKVDINYYVNQDLFGLQKINLNNGFSDPTFMREFLSYHLMREMGVPTPRNAFVNLYINDEHLGLYLAVEHVDDEFFKARFDPGDGDLYKAELGSDLLWKGNNIDNYPSLELKTNEDTSDHSVLLAMMNELNNGSDYEAVIDVDEVLRYLAVSTALTNLDSYQGSFAQNYYLYEDNGVFSIIPRDFNMSFGGFNMGCDRTSIIEFMIDEPTMSALSDRPLIAKLLQFPDYLEMYHNHLDQLISGPFAPETMDQMIDETAELIREYVYEDPTKFFTAQEFEQTLTSDLLADPNASIIAGFNQGFSLVIGLKAFVHERVASISDQLNGLALASGDGSGNCAGFVPEPGPGTGPGGFGDAIATVSPSYAMQGDTDVTVTITLIEQMQMLPAEINLLSVKIGSLEGSNISRNGLKITAVFDIPANEPAGMKDVSVEFEPPDFSDPNGQPPPGGMPPGGMPPGGMPPGGGFGDPNEFFGDPNDFDMIFTKTGAFEIRASGLPPGPPPSAIESISPSYATQADMNVAVTITLSQDMAMLPPTIIPLSVKIGQLEGSDITRNGLQITAVFDIPVNELTGMKDVSVALPPPPMDPNAQPMIFTKNDAFEIVRGYLPFTIGSTTTDDIVTDIPTFTPGGLYDATVLRTIYLEFSQEDWWQQLETNYVTEVNILADLTMEGNTYHDVGVRFKGMTSYMMTGNSQKKSFNIEIDATDPDQRLMGYKTLNLNNASMDPSFIREVLYFNIFRKYAPCPQANFIKLVINGEDWGIYVNAQQQNSNLIEEWFGDNDGNRWKVGMGRGQGGFFPPQSLADWLAGPTAEDLNNDGQINEVDFDIYIQSQMPPGGGWGGGPGMFDPNMYGDPNMFPGGWGGGGFVPIPFTDWLASPMAQDLNSDGQITEEDYDIFINSQPPGGGWGGGPGMFDPNFIPVLPTLQEWLASPMAQDLNSDGQITEEDYNIFINSQPMPPGGGMFDPNRFGDPNRIPGGWGGDGMFPGGGGMMFGGGNGALTWLGSDVAAYEQAYELKSEHTSDPWANLIAACDVLNNTPLDQLPEVADSVLAVDRWLWFLAMENIFTDEDSYLTKGWDYQIYYDPKTGQIHPLQHDGNETFMTRFVNQSPFEGENAASRPVISRLLAIPQFRERYLAHIRTIIEESLDWDVLAPQIEAYRTLIADEVQADTMKLYSYNQFEASFLDIQNFINGRRNYLLSHPEINRPAPEVSSVVRQVTMADSSSVLSGQPVWIIATVQGCSNIEQGILYYTDGKGPFEHISMFFADVNGNPNNDVSGNPNDVDILVGEIPPFPPGSIIRYYVEIRTANADEGNSFAPYNAEGYIFSYRVFMPIADSTPIVINELMASNQTTIQDPQGDYDDWIELLNVSDLEIDLSGMYLSDKEDNPLKWEIPTGTTLAPGAYLIIWADEDGGDEPGLHANFKLSAGGEMVSLVDTDERGNALLDSVVFGEQEADVSFGRFPDGTGEFQILSEPTPNDENFLLVLDNDGDGYTPDEGDCDDGNPAINPEAIEVYDGVDNDCDGLVDEEVAEIEDVSPPYAMQGDMNLLLTITLDEQMTIPADINPIGVKIGSLEGTDISRNVLEIMAVFDIPADELPGMKDVSIVFLPPTMNPNGQNLILTKSDAFEVRPWIPPEDAIAKVSPSSGKKGDDVTVTITLIEQMTMFLPEMDLLGVKIGSLEGTEISSNGLKITAVFDIPANATKGMFDVSVEFQLPNGQTIIFPKSDAFEVHAGGTDSPGKHYGWYIGNHYGWFNPVTQYMPQSLFGPQSVFGFGRQSWSSPQNKFGFGQQSWFMPQNAFGFGQQNWYGLPMQGGYGFGRQSWNDFSPNNWFGYSNQPGFGFFIPKRI